ncbi:MAG: sensor histidine kinase [Kineosporiaceae bacterium]
MRDRVRDRARHLRERWRRLDRRVLDGAVVAVLFAFLVAELARRAPLPGQHATTPWAYLLAAGLCLPFAMHRRHPVAALSVQCVVLLLYAPGAWVAYPGPPVFALVAGVALHTDRRRAALAATASAAALAIAVLWQPPDVGGTSTMVTSLLAVAVAWLWGENLRNRRARFAALEERARRAEVEREERARLAVAEERLRIARELHDVVAHALSVVAVQSGVAHHVLETRPDAAGAALAAIETTSRDALVEMRRLLGVLRRPDDAGTSRGPAPGLGDLPALADQVRAAGVDVALDVPSELPPLPAGVELSAYRIVQEGLTNVLRHCGPTATVIVCVEADALTLEVLDPGRAGAPPPEPGETTGGHGLVGMRERVAMFGGELSAGRVPGGGFRVRARLPVDATPPAGEPRGEGRRVSRGAP